MNYTFRKILVPTDFSPHSEEAFRVAYALARSTGARLIVFHVASPPATLSDEGRLLADKRTGKPLAAWEALRRAQADDPVVAVEHQAIVTSRTGATPILEALDSFDCDLIVMGTHGRTGLSHLLFGSIAEEVVRRARCPVVVVKVPPARLKDTSTSAEQVSLEPGGVVS